VAAVHGVAVGLGMELALAADIRVASEQARFGYFFVRRGLIGSAASLYYLPRIVGLGRAYELLLSGRLVDAAEADRIGLVSRVVPADELVAAVEETLDELRQAAPMSQRAVKRILRLGLTNDPAVVDEFSFQVLDTLFESQDHREAAAAFSERRAAQFRNA
jgi:enoyl-CoA hydratase/carnithine racemase